MRFGGSLLWKVKSSNERYSSWFVKVFDDELTLPDGKQISFSRLFLRDFVTILPIRRGKVVFVKNYRYPANDFFLELPSGIIDDDETPEACAHRELKEETGYDGKTTYVAWYYPSNRALQRGYIYHAKVRSSGKTSRDETEYQQVEELPIEVALKMFEGGEFKHAPTLVTLGLCRKVLRAV